MIFGTNNILVLLTKGEEVKDVLNILCDRFVESSDTTVLNITDTFSLFMFFQDNKRKGYQTFEFVRSQMNRLGNWVAIEADNILSATKECPKMFKVYGSMDNMNFKELSQNVFNIDMFCDSIESFIKGSMKSFGSTLNSLVSELQKQWGIPSNISNKALERLSETIKIKRCSDAIVGVG